MTENELKQRFFAQYFNQKVLISPMWPMAVRCHEGVDWHKKGFFLILKDLNMITDEDAGKAGFWGSKSLINDIETDGYDCLFIEQVDILRSLGYLLPFMHLSVQDLLNRGWAKCE